MIRYLLFSGIVALSACRNNSPSANGATGVSAKDTVVAVTDTKSSQTTSTAGMNDTIAKAKNDSTVRLVIEFYSIGSGTDYNAMIGYEDSIGAYCGRIKKNIDYLKKPWGREGETEFCLRLNELTASEQKDFIEFTRKMLKTAKWVNIHENSLCRH